MLNPNPEVENPTLVKYTFSNAMFLSVKLGIWEASLEKYIDQIEGVTEDLKRFFFSFGLQLKSYYYN